LTGAIAKLQLPPKKIQPIMEPESQTLKHDRRYTPARASCHNCPRRAQCLPDGASGTVLDELERSVDERRTLARHEVLIRHGQPGAHLYAIREGQFKTQRVGLNGENQVLGFPMSGELLGLEALSDGHYRGDAIALTASVICVLPYPGLAHLLAQEKQLQSQFHHLMCGEISRQQEVMLMLGSARAPQRLAAFLLDQSLKSQLRGGTGRKFQLHMSRQDIASYLGLSVASISRLLSIFCNADAMHVSNRKIELLAPQWLQQVVQSTGPASPPLVPL
jgi:CRP/FNR family transcriptional regulator